MTKKRCRTRPNPSPVRWSLIYFCCIPFSDWAKGSNFGVDMWNLHCQTGDAPISCPLFSVHSHPPHFLVLGMWKVHMKSGRNSSCITIHRIQFCRRINFTDHRLSEISIRIVSRPGGPDLRLKRDFYHFYNLLCWIVHLLTIMLILYAFVIGIVFPTCLGKFFEFERLESNVRAAENLWRRAS